MNIKTPLSRARGLGHASEGVSHFWRQRVTAVALIPLVIWFIYSAVGLAWKPYGAAIDFVAEPHNAVFLLLLIWASIIHLRLGLQTVIEDYVHDRFAKLACLILNDFFAAIVGVTCALAVIKIFVLAIPA
jgi:succinate dehydrogenase membrane anchor subunit